MSELKEKSGAIRINKYIASAGVASRRKADELIQAGRVVVNGQTVVDLGIKIWPNRDKIFVDGKQIVILDKPVYILFNKPTDCITTTSDERGRQKVLDYVRVRERIFPVGRLDRKTTGVLLLTNDGEIANRMMHPRRKIEKIYQVTLDAPITPEQIAQLRKGVKLEDGFASADEILALPGGKNKVLGVVLHEGRNRQVRRMFEKLGFDVKKLDRVSYAGLIYTGLRRGAWRYLTTTEIRKLKDLLGM